MSQPKPDIVGILVDLSIKAESTKGLSGMAEINKAAQAIFDRLAAEAIWVTTINGFEAVPLDKLKAIMEIKE